MLSALGATLCAVALAGLLWAERVEHGTARWVCKPLASLGFLLCALGFGLHGAYGWLVFVGLAWCAIGDVLLIPGGERTFQLGIAAFALGHLAYAAAFVQLGVDARVALAVGAASGAFGLGVWRWLSPHVPAALRVAVQVYIAIIATMVACALGAAVPAASARLALAAVAFFVSDLAVARDAFVQRAFLNRAWGLPTYYAAQLLFATTLG